MSYYLYLIVKLRKQTRSEDIVVRHLITLQSVTRFPISSMILVEEIAAVFRSRCQGVLKTLNNRQAIPL